MAGDLREQLESILNEGAATVFDRESNAFDLIADGESRPTIIVGAGGLGRKVLCGLRAAGRSPLAFTDNNSALWGTNREGLPVLPPQDAARLHGPEAVFVIAIWHPSQTRGMRHLASQFHSLGCTRIVPFPLLFWKYPDVFLPYYLWDLPSKLVAQGDAIRRAYALLADEASRIEFVKQVRFRSLADIECLPLPGDSPQYFVAELFSRSSEECFIDCGAYDGDTIRSFLDWSGGDYRKIIAFEADPANSAALQESLGADESTHRRTAVYSCAVGSARGRVRFAATGHSDAAISGAGGVEVECTTLDHALEGEQPTFIKMDIEGGELDALHGARHTISHHKPILAISAYHRQDHLWEVPLAISQLHSSASLFLRPYCMDGWELVCYAIPPNRSVTAVDLKEQA